MKTPEEIGKIVRELRGEMSLRDFASMCKLSHTALDAIECGYNKRSKKPTHTKAVTLQRIADAAGVPLSYITGDVKYVPPRDRLDALMLSMFNKLSLEHQEEVIKYINNLSSKEN